MATAKKTTKKKTTAKKSVAKPTTKTAALKAISKLPTKQVCSIAGSVLKKRGTSKAGTQLAYCKGSKRSGVGVRVKAK